MTFHNRHSVAEEILKELELMIYNKDKAVIDKYLHLMRFIQRKDCGKGYLHDILQHNLKTIAPLAALAGYNKQALNTLVIYQLLKNNQVISNKTAQEKAARINGTPLDIIINFRQECLQNRRWINDNALFRFMKWFINLFTLTNEIIKRIEQSGRFQRTTFFMPKDEKSICHHFGKRLSVASTNIDPGLNIRISPVA
jgi:hypothetical protein